MSKARTDFDRLLIDWADEFIQDLVVSFSATRPTPLLRVVVAGLYLASAVHLIWAVTLPFFREAVEQLLSQSSRALTVSQLGAFATSIIVGRMSYHLLLALAYILLSFVVRAARSWTRPVATVVLAVDVIAALNGLRAPRVSAIPLAFQWTELTLCLAIGTLLWLTHSPAPTTAKRTPRLSSGRVSF